jgi:hypothetical protein
MDPCIPAFVLLLACWLLVLVLPHLPQSLTIKRSALTPPLPAEQRHCLARAT